MDTPLLEVRHLKKYFDTPRGKLHAVDDLNFTIQKGQTLGMVGESGCGKSTAGRTVMMLHPPTAGEVLFEGENIVGAQGRALKELRRKMQIIFQDPFSSLNPRMTVFESIAHPLIINGIYKNNNQAEAETLRLMELVGLSRRLVNTYPHELDGGRRQRVGIARALSLQPQFIVCDEPVSSLDVSIQAQVLNLLKDLQAEFHLTYLFITHDLSVVKFFSDKIAVMYLGQLVETADSAELFRQPLHPYSQALLSAIPIPSSRQKMQRVKLIGELQSPIDPEPGCRFAKRCLYAREGCTGRDLALRDFGSGHFCACCRAGALEEQTPSK